MQFCDWASHYAIAKAARWGDADSMPAHEWYERQLSHPSPTQNTVLLHAQQRWLAAKRPYYNVWPAISEALCRLTLDIDAGQIQLPIPELLVRLPVAAPLPMMSQWKLRSMLLSDTTNDARRGVALSMDFGQTHIEQGHTIPVYPQLTFSLEEGWTVEATLARFVNNTANHDLRLAILQCVRLACTLCLLGDNPDVIRPDVLEMDRAKYDASHDAKYPAKAVRRGKVGWDVGRDLEPVNARGEVMPHYRRPHMGLRWTGEGHAVPRIVPISGSIVRRGKLVQVPTGRLDA